MRKWRNLIEIRFTCRLEPEVYDTMYRMKQKTLVDASKITNEAVKKYLLDHDYELRLNTEEENEEIFGKD